MSERAGIGWWMTGAGVFLALAAAVLWLGQHLTWPGGAAEPRPRVPRVAVAEGAQSVLGLAWVESAALLGPAPLFLPTDVNSSQIEPPANLRREPGAQTATFPARLWHTDQSLTTEVASPFPALNGTEDVLHLGQTLNPWTPLPEKGQEGVKPLSPRRLRVEVERAPGGEAVWAADYDGVTGPAPVPASDWRPLEFVLTVAAEGVVASPVLIQGSGLAEWDSTVQAWLLRQSQLGLRLWPGVYAVRVGP